jgi:hypothetical protein
MTDTTRNVLYNLFWSTTPFDATAVVPVGSFAVVSPLPPVEAIILFPAFLTPAVCARDAQQHFEILLLAPAGLDSAEPLNVRAHQGDHGGNAVDRVNRRLKISRFLDPRKWATALPLFDDPKPDLLKVEKIGRISDGSPKLRDTAISSGSLFRGRVDKRFWDALAVWQDERIKEARKRHRPEPDLLDTLFRVRVNLKCLERAGPTREDVKRFAKSGIIELAAGAKGLWGNVEPHDELIWSVLRRHNGEALRPPKEGDEKRDEAAPGSIRTFRVRQFPRRVELANRTVPVCAYHPLFVRDKLGYARVGHVADLHINSRQHFLARTPARVVETDPDGAHVSKTERPESRKIGELITIYSDNVLSILDQFAQGERDTKGHFLRRPIDVLLLGGDLIDHVKNCFPSSASQQELAKRDVTPAKVWEVLDLGDSGARKRNYQAFVDHMSVYSMLKHFCSTYQKPAFVVSGNHDAYMEPYGISPRPFAPASNMRANEGIPADHNLTFYEAILAFGESYARTDIVSSLGLHTELFEWFYTVFTPFADFAADLPKQRIVGLAWGDSEGKVLPADTKDAHGAAHLPRADNTLTPEQEQFFKDAFGDKNRKVILFTHFTFVSYKNEIPNFLPNGTADKASFPVHGTVATGTFSKQDWGTFEKLRKPAYQRIHDADKGGSSAGPHLQAVLTGHSHRRGLYYVDDAKGGRKVWALDTRDRLPFLASGACLLMATPIAILPLAAVTLSKRISEDVFGTAMFPIQPQFPNHALEANRDRTPIVVSDSAGPVPRANLFGEFGEWGSDRPSGTYLEFDEHGVAKRLDVVGASHKDTRPRAAVAIDYLHVNEKHGIVSILGEEFGWFPAYYEDAAEHTFKLEFHSDFARNTVQVERAVIHGVPYIGAPFIRVPLDVEPLVSIPAGELPSPFVTLIAPRERNRDLSKLMTVKGPRFLSLKFKARYPWLEAVYDFGAGGWWDFEVSVALEGSAPKMRYRLTPKVEFPDFKLRKQYFGKKYGAG